MALGKVTKDFGGSSGEVYKIGEVLTADINDPLFRVGFLRPIEESTSLIKCSCGRQFMELIAVEAEGDEDAITDAEQHRQRIQLLTAHCQDLGKGHRPAMAARLLKVAEPVKAVEPEKVLA